jgi:hypothetical protein
MNQLITNPEKLNLVSNEDENFRMQGDVAKRLIGMKTDIWYILAIHGDIE